MDLAKKKRYWKWCCIAAMVLSLISFTPVIIPSGIYRPMLFGIPYTLWTGFIITVALVTVTFIGTRVHPGMKDEEGRQ
jgi:hypothetical protein